MAKIDNRKITVKPKVKRKPPKSSKEILKERIEKKRKEKREAAAKPKLRGGPKPTAKTEAEKIRKRRPKFVFTPEEREEMKRKEKQLKEKQKRKSSVLPKKDSSFKLRSGNKPSIAKMSGVSPVKALPAVIAGVAKGARALYTAGKLALRTPAGRRALSKVKTFGKNLTKTRKKPKIDMLPPGGGKKKGMSTTTKLTALYGASEVGKAIDKRVQAKKSRPSITGKPKTTTPGTPRKNIKPKKSTGITTYRQAYNKMSTQQRSKFKNYADFESQAKSYNRKKYGTINPTATARKQGISKSELAKKNKSMSKKAPKIALKPVKNSRGQTVYVQNSLVGKKAKKI